MKTLFVFAATLLLAISCGCDSGKPAKKKASRLEQKVASPDWASLTDQQRWQRIQKTESTQTTASDYWFDIHSQASGHFHSAYTKNPREWAEFYVAQFDKHGSAADMRWLMCDFGVHLPVVKLNWQLPPKYRNRMVTIWEFTTRRLLADENFRKRYHHFLMYYRLFYGSPSSQPHYATYAAQELRDVTNQHPQYWFHARNFVMLCHAFNRADLLLEVEAENLDSRFKDLNEALDKHKGLRAKEETLQWSLSPDEGLESIPIPDLPFPDWDSKIDGEPPRWQLFNDLT